VLFRRSQQIIVRQGISELQGGLSIICCNECNSSSIRHVDWLHLATDVKCLQLSHCVAVGFCTDYLPRGVNSSWMASSTLQNTSTITFPVYWHACNFWPSKILGLSTSINFVLFEEWNDASFYHRLSLWIPYGVIFKRRFFSLLSAILVSSGQTLCGIPVLRGQCCIHLWRTAQVQWINLELIPR
jgi:hypothetical protein